MEKQSWERREIPGQLGEKRERYLCAMRPPDEAKSLHEGAPSGTFQETSTAWMFLAHERNCFDSGDQL